MNKKIGKHATAQSIQTNPGVQRSPKDGMGEQRPKGEGREFVSYARELGLSPVGCGKLPKSFK